MLIEIILEIIINLVFHIPGAFIRWGMTGFKKGGLNKYLKSDPFVNSLSFFLFIVLIGLIILLLS